MMRILQLISEKPPIKSGFARVIGRLTEELEKIGYDVTVLSAYDCRMKAAGEVKIVLGTDRISEEIRRGYDIVHIHGHTPTFSDRLLLKSKLYRGRIVYTLHCLTNYYLKPLSYIYNAIINSILLKLADAVVTTSKSYYDMLPETMNKYMIPWGVDYEKFSGERIPHEDYRILFVGQMRPYKGLKILLKAVKGLDLTLNIVGDGPDRREYEEYAKKLGLRNVHLHGAIPDEELKNLYLSSDVLVLPSISMNEAFGLVTLEAAAAGCAVIASDLPGVRDLVRKFGILVKPRDPYELRKAIVDLKDETLREMYVERGLKTVPLYSWRKTAEQYDTIYKRCLDDT
ncbi:MAG: glycosyltransferase family 4 protein [Candidatus Bathyarchaeia archaeon]